MGNWLVVTAVCVLLAVVAEAQAIYVSPKGNDSYSGKLPALGAARTEGPKATLSGALEAARKLPPGKTRRIIIKAGEYFLDSTVTLAAEDANLTIEAAKGEKVVLYGGRRITGWEPDGDGLWAAKLPQVDGKAWDFRMLAVNGRFCKRARLPKEGTFTHLTVFDVPWMSTTGGGWKRKPTQEELTTLKYKPEDLGPWLDTRNAEITVYHMWDESVVGVAAMDTEKQTITFTNPAGHPPGAFGVRKYVVWNVRQGMTEPGQWYLDRTANKVVYKPLPGEDMRKAEVLAPTMDVIFRVNGTEAAPVKDVTLRGLTLSLTNTPLKAGGFGASAFEGAVNAIYAPGLRLEGLTIQRVNGQGIAAWKCPGMVIENCETTQTGACGIKADCVGAIVRNNHVHHIGLTYPSAIALSVGGTDVAVSHNEVHDCPYSGITFGGNDCVIEGNLIYRAMQELHDGAAIYITFCKRVAVRGNLVRDIVDTGGYGASAYYLDEQAEDCVVEGNISESTGWPSHNHMAKHNTIRNNVFHCPGEAKLTFPKSSDYTFEHNVLVAKGKISFSNPAAITTWKDNVFFSGTGEYDGPPADAVKADPKTVDTGKMGIVEVKVKAGRE